MEAHCISLAQLKTPEQIQTERPHIFPSKFSLDWAIRVNRDRLLTAGALRKVAGRLFLVPELFDQVMLDDGLEALRQHRDA